MTTAEDNITIWSYETPNGIRWAWSCEHRDGHDPPSLDAVLYSVGARHAYLDVYDSAV